MFGIKPFNTFYSFLQEKQYFENIFFEFIDTEAVQNHKIRILFLSQTEFCFRFHSILNMHIYLHILNVFVLVGFFVL